MLSRDAQYVVYLVDPGSNRPGIMMLLQDLLGVNPEGAAEYLRDFPSPISSFAAEADARALASRFRDFDAVAVVRPADKPLAPAPVEEIDTSPVQRGVQVLLMLLGVAQLGAAGLWFWEGRVVAAFFGLLLGVYVLIYFGLRLRR
jgi:hypothetical protein